MKISASLIVLFLLFSLLSSCIQEDADQCVNALDCFNGFVCVDGMCVDPNAGTGDKDSVQSDSDSAVTTDSDADQTVSDNQNDTAPDADGVQTDPDQIVDEEADEVPDPDTVVDCEPGFHFEAEGDDEDGDGKRGCVKNVTCIKEPCNGGVCTELEYTVSCKCTTGYAGRWCTDCDTNYLKSTVDSKCKPDCTIGTYNCTGTKECKVDPAKNEAGCGCKEFFLGTDCTLCDAAHFCSNHGSCSAATGSAVCTCDAAWSGNANCSACGQGYIVDGANCIQGCKYYCGASAGQMIDSALVTATSHGTCQIVSGSAKCICEAGWKDPALKGIIGIYIIPECSECDTANPPVGGCPE